MGLKEKLEQQLSQINLAESYDEDYLTKIGIQIIEWYEDDESSRKEWKERTEGWMKLATQVIEKKTYPWPDSANVKYPLLTTAAMQFAARAYPALIPGASLVQGQVIGVDQNGQKRSSAERIGRHMSYQLLYEMDKWEEDMDKLCIVLPILGCMFKKTWRDPVKNVNVSELVWPQELVIDYYAKSVETANRKCHIIYKNKNEVEERVRKGLFRKIDLGSPSNVTQDFSKDKIAGTQEPKITPATPYKLIECHCWWDLDDDGYDEPYIVTVHYDTRKVLRIVPRFTIDSVEIGVVGNEEQILKITPVEYFTKFGFIPNPDGGIYDLGFGLLLGGINEVVNTLTNQLLDSGTLNNLQAGFLGRGIRVRGGNTRFIPGEWKPVDFSGDDIKKHIFSIPTKEPSGVLYQLLETLVTSGKEVASVADIFVGKMPGQNTPATTTMASIEQGSKVFTAIYKRQYRSLAEEYRKLFELNRIHLPEGEKLYFTINEPQGPVAQEVMKEDYSKGVSVKPNADPQATTDAQKMLRLQSIGPLLQLGTINPAVYTRQFLEGVGMENISEWTNYQAPPPPDVLIEQQKLQEKMQTDQGKLNLEQLRMLMEADNKKKELALEQLKLQLEEKQSSIDAINQHMDHLVKQLDIQSKVKIASMKPKISETE